MRLPAIVCFLAGLMAVVGVVACGRTALPISGAEAMHVELDIFSGRPNPSWELTPADSTIFLQQLRALPQTVAGQAEEGLGYRGLVVTETGGVLIDSFATIVVSGGLVVGQRPQGGAQTWLDTGRSLERWLARTGKPHLDPDIYAQVVQILQL